jgi:hypothetical protein
VQRNQGGGAFTPPVGYPGPDDVHSIAVGDLNGDGAPDVAVASVHGDVFVYLNNGDGTFAAGKPHKIGKHSNKLAIGEVDGDGRPDIVLSLENSSAQLAVLRNQGGGVFGSPMLIGEAGLYTSALAIGDVNGDKIPDLVALDSHVPQITIFVGMGGGVFGGPMSITVPHVGTSLAMRDLNGDGAPDLAYTTVDDPVGAEVTILLNHGDGTFPTITSIPVGQSSPYAGISDLAMADLNGDGAADLALAGELAVVVLPGHGDGTFADPVPIPGSLGAEALTVTDLQRDGRLDLFVLNQAQPTGYTVQSFVNTCMP